MVGGGGRLQNVSSFSNCCLTSLQGMSGGKVGADQSQAATVENVAEESPRDNAASLLLRTFI